MKPKCANVQLIDLTQMEFNVSLVIFLTSGTKPPKSVTIAIVV